MVYSVLPFPVLVKLPSLRRPQFPHIAPSPSPLFFAPSATSVLKSLPTTPSSLRPSRPSQLFRSSLPLPMVGHPLSLFFSHSSALIRALQRPIPCLFKQIRTLAAKHPGWGYIHRRHFLFPQNATSSQAPTAVSPVSATLTKARGPSSHPAGSPFRRFVTSLRRYLITSLPHFRYTIPSDQRQP